MAGVAGLGGAGCGPAGCCEPAAGCGRPTAAGRPSPVRAVIFDKDGVLVNTEPELARRRHAFFVEQGIDDSAFPDFWGSNNQEIWTCVEPHDLARRETLYQAFRKRFVNDPMPYAVLATPGVAEVLRRLRAAGVVVGLASSSPRWVIEDFVADLGIADLFDVTMSGEECPATKPAPDVYLRGMERLGVGADQTVVVEDSPVGILAARRAGAYVCAMPLPAGVGLDQSLAHERLGRLEDVLAVAGA